MKYAELLSAEQVARVHEASLWVLENVGILAHHPKAREVFKSHGCAVSDEHVVTFPPEVVDRYMRLCPPRFTFRGRDPQFDRTIPDGGPVVVTGSSAPNVVDPVTGVERRATSTDIANIAHLINELKGFDVFSISTLADDAPLGQFSLSRFYPALKNCLKPVRSNTPNMDDLHMVLKLGELIAGGKEAYYERPIINHHYCPMVSPLTMDVDSTEAVMYLTGEGLPVYTTVVPNAGLTSPMTLMGTLVVGNAEFLAIAVFQQMVKEGTPLIYASLPTVADMRTGAVRARRHRDRHALHGAGPARALLQRADRRLHRPHQRAQQRRPGRLRDRHEHTGRGAGRRDPAQHGRPVQLAHGVRLRQGRGGRRDRADEQARRARPRVQRGEPGPRRDRRGRPRRRLHEEPPHQVAHEDDGPLPQSGEPRHARPVGGRPAGRTPRARRAPSPAASSRGRTRPCGTRAWTRASARSSRGS